MLPYFYIGLVLATVFGVCGGMVWFYFWLRKYKERQPELFSETMKDLGAEKIGHNEYRLSGNDYDIVFRAKFIRDKHGIIRYWGRHLLHVQIVFDDGDPTSYEYDPWDWSGEFRVQEENVLRKVMLWLGISKDFETGNPEFDRRYYVESKNEEGTASFLSSNKRTRAIQFLLSEGFTDFVHKPESIHLGWNWFWPASDLSNEKLRRIQSALETLAETSEENLVEQSTRTYEREMDRWNKRANTFLTVSVLSFCLVFFLWVLHGQFYQILNSTKFLWDSLWYGLIGFGLFMTVAIYLLRGKAQSHRTLFLVSINALLGIPGLVWLGGTHVNCLLDRSETVSRVLRVEDKHIEQLDESYDKYDYFGPEYYLMVSGNDQKVEGHYLLVNKSTFSSFNKGDRLRIKTGSGFLGYEWIRSIEPVR